MRILLFVLLLSLPAFADAKFRIYMTGGAAGAETFTPFIKDANHGNIVVLKASEHEADWYDKNIPLYGEVKSVETIIFLDRSKSNDPEVYKKIMRADGLFIAGGNQFNYFKYWKDTLVETAINKQLAMDTPVGGTSAGLAILGEFYYSADPDGAPIKTDFIESALLRGIITDTHFKERDRFRRLRIFVRYIKDKYNVDTLGVGIDEATTLIVNKNGLACVSGAGSVWLLEKGRDTYDSYNDSCFMLLSE